MSVSFATHSWGPIARARRLPAAIRMKAPRRPEPHRDPPLISTVLENAAVARAMHRL